jgi:hypothetical protein
MGASSFLTTHHGPLPGRGRFTIERDEREFSLLKICMFRTPAARLSGRAASASYRLQCEQVRRATMATPW